VGGARGQGGLGAGISCLSYNYFQVSGTGHWWPGWLLSSCGPRLQPVTAHSRLIVRNSATIHRPLGCTTQHSFAGGESTGLRNNTLVGTEHSAPGLFLWQERVHLDERAAKIGVTASKLKQDGRLIMSTQSDHFREQAARAERLARSILDEEASKRLLEASAEFRRQAEQLDERPNKTVVKRL
jgi:hypothetical protein